VDAFLGHGLDGDRVDLVARLGAPGADVDRAVGEGAGVAGGHLGAAGVVDADEEDDGLVGHQGSVLVVVRGNRSVTIARPMAPPISWAQMKGRAEVGVMPAKVSEKTRPMVTAGLANEVELVNQ